MSHQKNGGGSRMGMWLFKKLLPDDMLGACTFWEGGGGRGDSADTRSVEPTEPIGLKLYIQLHFINHIIHNLWEINNVNRCKNEKRLHLNLGGMNDVTKAVTQVWHQWCNDGDQAPRCRISVFVLNKNDMMETRLCLKTSRLERVAPDSQMQNTAPTEQTIDLARNQLRCVNIIIIIIQWTQLALVTWNR